MRPMRSALLHIGVLCLLAPACGGDEDGFEVRQPGSGDLGLGDGGSIFGDGGGLDSHLGDVNLAGPIIEIRQPEEGGMIVRDEVTVAAKIVDSSPPGIDPESVRVRVVEKLNDPPLLEKRMDLTDTQEDLWSATIALGGLPGGRLEVVVFASDTDDPPNTNEASVVIRHDTGPFIEFLAPSQNGQYFNTAMNYSFRVLYTEGTAPDGCTIDEVSVSGVEFSPQRVIDDPCTWEGTVDFEEDFDPDLIDNQYVLLVKATNSEGTTSTAQRTFYVDNTGPVIVFYPEPPVGTLHDDAIVGGTIDITVKATDPSGVVATSVIAQVAGPDTDAIPLLPIGGDQYSAVYDTSELDTIMASPSIEVTAEDTWGNFSSRSIVVHIDNCPPIISLHPPPYRNRKPSDDAPTKHRCSHEFDPVGWETADDPSDPPDPYSLELHQPAFCQPQLFFVRARVEDESNQRPGQFIVYPSQVVPESVELFAYDGPEPLIVDLDADGDCDDINPSLEPTPGGLPGEAWHNNMNPLDPTGTADFTPDPLDLPIPGICDDGSDEEAPDPLCDPTELTIAAHQDDATEVPVIYSLGRPVAGPLCGGSEFDARGNGFGNGWLCMAVRARDGVGNIGISDPLRVYVDLSEEGWCQNPALLPPPPSCTDGCDFRDWPRNNVFPPFPQKFIRPGQDGFPYGEITDG